MYKQCFRLCNLSIAKFWTKMWPSWQCATNGNFWKYCPIWRLWRMKRQPISQKSVQFQFRSNQWTQSSMQNWILRGKITIEHQEISCLKFDKYQSERVCMEVRRIVWIQNSRKIFAVVSKFSMIKMWLRINRCIRCIGFDHPNHEILHFHGLRYLPKTEGCFTLTFVSLSVSATVASWVLHPECNS